MFGQEKPKIPCNTEVIGQGGQYAASAAVRLLAWCTQCTEWPLVSPWVCVFDCKSVGCSLCLLVLQQGIACITASWQGHQDRGFGGGGWEEDGKGLGCILVMKDSIMAAFSMHMWTQLDMLEGYFPTSGVERRVVCYCTVHYSPHPFSPVAPSHFLSLSVSSSLTFVQLVLPFLPFAYSLHTHLLDLAGLHRWESMEALNSFFTQMSLSMRKNECNIMDAFLWLLPLTLLAVSQLTNAM